jgi:uncharacterized protein YegL/uncharacterized membrane protein YqiK
MFRKLAISLILATITPLIWANKSQTQTLVEENFIVFPSEDTTPSKPLNINSSTLITQKFRNFSKFYSQPIIIAQFTVGTIIPTLVIVIIGAVVLIFFVWKAKLFLLIGKDEVGIVDKKWDFNLSLRLPPGRIIALNGEPGIQAKILETGPHFGYFSWQYTITKVPVITISKEEIGLVEARDGLPLEPGQNFAKIVDCNNFQDIKAFFDNGGQIGKQRAILTNGTYRINTEIFRCHQVSVTRIEAHQIGLVEALDGSPLKPGKNFGRTVNCKDFQDTQAFFDNGGQVGKQIDILPPGTYKINTDIFKIVPVQQLLIGTEEIGLVEAQDGVSLNPGESFGKVVNCDDFQDGNEFIRKGGQRGKQCGILREGTYRINTELFKVRIVPLTSISSGEIGLVEAKYGKPLEQGKNFAKKVDCNNFQDAQAFFDNGGQAGRQLAILEPGTYYINPEIFTIRTVPIIRIPQGEIGLVIANEGTSKSDEQTLGRAIECDNFQDAEAFLKNGGQTGKQLAILTAGDYKINTDFFTVITTANARKHNENPEKLKVYKIDKDKIGILTTTVGKTLSEGKIAGPIIEGHDNYQNAQKFLDLEGYKGLQEEVLQEGDWNLNPWFVEVEQVPLTIIEQEEVGVVISFVGEEYGDQEPVFDDQENSSYQLVPKGYKGVQEEPLTTGKYPINTRIKTVKLVPTTQIILNWSDEKKHPSNYDYKLKKMKLTSFDGYEIFVQFTQIIRLAAHNAPKMICLVGSSAGEDKIYVTDDSGKVVKKYPAIKNLVARVLTKIVSSHFLKAATGTTAIEFQKTRDGLEKAAKAYIEQSLKDFSFEGCGTVIDTIDLPPELDEYRQRLEPQKQEAEAEKLRQQRKRTELVGYAEIRVEVAQIEVKCKLQKKQLDLEIYRTRLDIEASQKERISLIEINALKEEIAALSPELYVQIETQGKWAEAMAQMKINYPQIMMTGGGNSSSGDTTSNYFQLLQLDHLETLRNRLNPGAPIASLPPNQEQKSLPGHSTKSKIPVVLLLDTSSSMFGERIDSLNAGISAFKKEFEPNTNISQNLELAIVTCNSHRETFQGFVNMDNFIPVTLEAEGETTIGKGIDSALNNIESYQDYCQKNNFQYRKPLLFLIIGGSPTDDWKNSAERARQAVEANKLNFFVVGVKGADMTSLRQIAPPKTPPKTLDNFKFRELFQWLADYLKKVSSSEKGTRIRPLPTTEWEAS